MLKYHTPSMLLSESSSSTTDVADPKSEQKRRDRGVTTLQKPGLQVTGE